MAKKSTKKSIKKTTSYHKSSWAKHTVVAVSLAAALCVIISFATAFAIVKYNSITAAEKTYLDTVPELASNFIQNNEIIYENQSVAAEMTEYGVSDKDGTFYIGFQFVAPSDAGTGNLTKGKVYFQIDDAGKYSYVYSYDN